MVTFLKQVKISKLEYKKLYIYPSCFFLNITNFYYNCSVLNIPLVFVLKYYKFLLVIILISWCTTFTFFDSTLTSNPP